MRAANWEVFHLLALPGLRLRGVPADVHALLLREHEHHRRQLEQAEAGENFLQRTNSKKKKMMTKKNVYTAVKGTYIYIYVTQKTPIRVKNTRNILYFYLYFPATNKR